MVHGRPGVAPQTEKREWFARLIAQGISNVVSCLIVGVIPRTGSRCRLGRTITSGSGRRLHYPPVTSAPKPEISPRYLSEDERVTIADLRRRGSTVRAIATELGRSPATVSRELRRNLDPGSAQYRPFTAQRLAAGRRARPGRGKLVRDPGVATVRAAAVDEAVESGAGQRSAASGVPRRARAAGGARDDLPSDLPPRARRAVP